MRSMVEGECDNGCDRGGYSVRVFQNISGRDANDAVSVFL